MSVNINADTTNGLVLTSDTSGEIKLQSAGADIATVTSSGITMASGKSISGAGAGGKILQVVSAIKTDTLSTNSTSYTDVMSASITPSSASNKILILVRLSWSTSGHAIGRLLRDATPIAIGDAASARKQVSFYNADYSDTYHIESASLTWLDSPSTTSSTTYKVQVGVPDAGYYATVNRGYSDPDVYYQGRTVSSITLLEVAG